MPTSVLFALRSLRYSTINYTSMIYLVIKISNHTLSISEHKLHLLSADFKHILDDEHHLQDANRGAVLHQLDELL